MRRLALVVLASTFALGGCEVWFHRGPPPLTDLPSPAPSADAGIPDRPLALPTFGPSCPRSIGHGTLPDVGPGIGDGPVWPEGFVAGPAYQPLGSNPIDGWYPIKILWAAAPSYMGPFRVRGQRIDQPGSMMFSLDAGRTMTPELLLPGETGPSAERQWPSYTLVETAGCYAYQIDGLGFSETSVFEVAP